MKTNPIGIPEAINIAEIAHYQTPHLQFSQAALQALLHKIPSNKI
jgi:hypothetical protein